MPELEGEIDHGRSSGLGMGEGATWISTPRPQPITGRHGSGGVRGGCTRPDNAAGDSGLGLANADRRGGCIAPVRDAEGRADRELRDGLSDRHAASVAHRRWRSDRAWRRRGQQQANSQISWSHPSGKQVSGGMIYAPFTFRHLNGIACNHSDFRSSG